MSGIAAVSIVDEHRQWFKSTQGLQGRETPRSVSFCDHTIRQDLIIEVSDARTDPRFADNPLVDADPNIVFYAGYPLSSPDGFTVGALCAIDTRERVLDGTQRQALKDLAGVVQAQSLLAARYGGEEFLVMLPDTDATGARIKSRATATGRCRFADRTDPHL